MQTESDCSSLIEICLFHHANKFQANYPDLGVWITIAQPLTSGHTPFFLKHHDLAVALTGFYIDFDRPAFTITTYRLPGVYRVKGVRRYTV